MHSMPESNPEPRRRGNPAFVPGNRLGRPRPTKAEKLARLEAKLRELAARFGGVEVLDAIDLERLRLAAELLVRRPPKTVDATRCINTADRLIRAVERRVGRGRAGPKAALGTREWLK
jgi:hypothetical protein